MREVNWTLRQARVEQGWRQSDLAHRAGLTRETVARIENGKVVPHEETVALLVKAFGAPFTAQTLGLA